MWPAIIGAGAVIGSALLANKGQKDANEESAEQAQLNREFNSAEAAKSRDWQEEMRRTQYQTTVSDLKAAGLNPMLAYQQGGAGTPSGATAANSSMPTIGNKVTAALSAGAQAAQIMNIKAQTEKTEADTKVSEATAKQVEAQTHLTSTSATNVAQQTENLKEQIAQIRENVKLQAQQGTTEQQRRVLMSYEAQLKQIQAEVENERLPLTKAQTELTRVTTQLNKLEVAGATNRANSETTWWGRNVRPYLGDVGKITNSSSDAANSLYQLRR